MDKHLLLLAALVLLFSAPAPLFSQSLEENQEYRGEVGVVEYLGKTQPLREIMKELPPGYFQQVERKKSEKPAKEIRNFLAREYFKAREAVVPEEYEKDPVVQFHMGGDTSDAVLPLVNVEGMGQNIAGVFPPDVNGDVGRDYFVQTVNASSLRVFDKTTGQQVGGTINSDIIWGDLNVQSGGDPILLYDQEAGRWFFLEFIPPSLGFALLIAISETEDPLGAWSAYSFQTQLFPDYPKVGIWPNAYVITVNEFSGVGGVNTNAFFLLDREAMLRGDEDVDLIRFTIPTIPGLFFRRSVTPVDWDGFRRPPEDNPIYLLRLRDNNWSGIGGADRVEMWRATIDWADPQNATVTGPTNFFVASYDSGVNGGIPEPDGSPTDALDERLMHRIQYRNFGDYDVIVACQTVQVGPAGNIRSGIRWHEFRRPKGGGWSIHQEGTYAPNDGLYRFMPAIAMDGSGNIAIGYSVASNSKFLSLRYTGRRTGDPLGEMTLEEQEFISGGSGNPVSRWGDYFSMSIDPTDERTFWFTGEYMLSNGAWSTRIVSFQFDSDTLDAGPLALIGPSTSGFLTDKEAVTISCRNYGKDTISNFVIGFRLDDDQVYTTTVTDTLPPRAEVTITFPDSVDLSAFQQYEFKIFTDLQGDQNQFNDTVIARVDHLFRYDASLGAITGLNDYQVCDTAIGNIGVELINQGQDTLVSVILVWQVNDNDPDSTLWTGRLEPGEREIVDLPVRGLEFGQNNLTIFSTNPNGVADNNVANDLVSQDVEVIADGVTFFLEITFDGFPREISWELRQNNQVVLSGGPYFGVPPRSAIREEWCLREGDCFRFTIFDSRGDGIFPPGGYRIVDEYGKVFAKTINPLFGSSESQTFCATFECGLEVSALSTKKIQQDSSDGSILMIPVAGVPPFVYSFNGAPFDTLSVFDSLAAGTYTIIARDANGCLDTVMAEVLNCNLELTATVQGARNDTTFNGSITLDVDNARAPVEYSIDTGRTFQTEAIFDSLPAGEFLIIARDADGCEEGVLVLVTADREARTFGRAVQIIPNPNDGMFQIYVTGLQGVDFLPVQIYNNQGQLVKHARLARFGEKLIGSVYIRPLPAGVYYLRLMHPDIQQVEKVVKE